MSLIEVDQVVSKQFEVKEFDTAKSVGSGGMDVLASPTIVKWVENTTYEFIESSLGKGYTSVGVQFVLNHIAPSLVTAKISVEIRVIEVKGKKIKVEFKVLDNFNEVANGTHTRVVVSEIKFLTNAYTQNGIR